ncbi:stress response transcription factor SrrA/Skn7, putative [Talaromyces stipitatus ATCC 10500]|uniref:Transcription factor n=1 Tax=Talaromyces stipitatus (strain ATCC 10500 / CBS 375.48 / QM 6759 / NRRL 1006) TaxID=441959 RepID=B8MD12_TALSN|nr:stress response transcription factor SrrA/Skn7, putative [Talaromyces stipitatus ATCC 10500]EED17538.1 stress response transcription factor SrrA/Skn7, putative [Talaromyces stipitatus ATCC 10500]
MDGQTTGTSSAGNSSDFVRKLYKMLEDPSYSDIVRWGDENDSFVVLECEKFTKTILPKHFKHSNFASFVRQLNKYDFHKVRQNNEETGQSPYGPNAWEFKHPEFKANNKDSLDNIRRKAPAPRKPAQMNEDSVPTQQIDLMNSQIMAQQQQIQSLTDRNAQLSVDSQVIMQEVMRLQKTILQHENVIHNVMNYLFTVDARHRRDSRASGAFAGQDGSAADDLPASPLQQASKILSDLSSSQLPPNLVNFDSLNDPTKAQMVSTPPLGAGARNGIARGPNSAGSNPSIGFVKMNGELETAVYPVGATNGIDPMYSEHVNNIPYSIQPKDMAAPEAVAPQQQQIQRPFNETRKKNTFVNPGWIKQPNILLVEDDDTCRQIGGKFLGSFQCQIDNAYDGLQAVTKVQSGKRYDLILMDIIMPNLDGVSACHLIRQFDRTPIIAMTSNIRKDDIELYFQHGMDDVLPKPFTRKSLLDMLEKHLMHLKTVPTTTMDPASVTPMTTHTSAAQSIKEDSSPGQSPAASMNNWQSPGQLQGMSPVHLNVQQVPQYMQPMTPAGPFAIDQNGVQYATPSALSQPPLRPQHRRQVSDMSSTPDAAGYAKRQRMYSNPQMMPQMAGQQNG